MFIRILQDLLVYRATLIVLLTPLVLSPIIIAYPTQEIKCMYAVIIMAVFWITEAVPLAITALLPLILFPVLGVSKAKVVASSYLTDPLILFTGGFFVAIAVEQSQLHRRIALKVLLIFGENPKWILFALMSTTAFLSMWISNTATTAMMLPIVEAIVIEIIKDRRSRKAANVVETKLLMGSKDFERGDQNSQIIQLNRDSLNDEELNMCKMMFLSICYSSNIGGVGTLTGTPPNIIVQGMLETLYRNNCGVTYASWMGLAVPIVIINLVFAWCLLQIYFLGWHSTFKSDANNKQGTVKNVMQSHYNSLGKMRYVSDATAAMFIAFLLFVLPSELPDFAFNPNRDLNKNPVIRESLLTWPVVQAKFPWGLMLLVGGSFAMAGAIEESGLSSAIGINLAKLSSLPGSAICVVAALLATFVTEITSNSATASVLAPILAAVAQTLHVNPLYLVLTATICVSYAFMLPVATAPNAIVFGYGLLKVVDMVKVGFIMNCITVCVTLLAINTWGWALFNLGTYPDWAIAADLRLNETLLASLVNNTMG